MIEDILQAQLNYVKKWDKPADLLFIGHKYYNRLLADPSINPSVLYLKTKPKLAGMEIVIVSDDEYEYGLFDNLVVVEGVEVPEEVIKAYQRYIENKTIEAF